MRIISAVFALVGSLPVMPAAVASSLDGATRLYALLIFVLICAAVAFFASLSPSRRRAREIRRQVLQQQNQAMNQQGPPPQAPNQQVPPQQGPSQQVPPQQVQGAVSYPMHYQPKPAQPGNSAQPGHSTQQAQAPSPHPASPCLTSASSAGGCTFAVGADAGRWCLRFFGTEPFSRKPSSRKPGAAEHAPEHPGAA